LALRVISADWTLFLARHYRKLQVNLSLWQAARVAIINSRKRKT